MSNRGASLVKEVYTAQEVEPYMNPHLTNTKGNPQVRLAAAANFVRFIIPRRLRDVRSLP